MQNKVGKHRVGNGQSDVETEEGAQRTRERGYKGAKEKACDKRR